MLLENMRSLVYQRKLNGAQDIAGTDNSMTRRRTSARLRCSARKFVIWGGNVRVEKRGLSVGVVINVCCWYVHIKEYQGWSLIHRCLEWRGT